MRVTTQQTYVSMTQSFNNLSGDLAHVVEQMATGKQILQPSDDPIAATRITQLNRQQSAIEQYQSNIDSASAGLSQQESILDGVTDSYSYQGNSDHRQTTVSNGVEVDTNVAASDFFGSNLDVLNTLNSLSQELQNPDVDPADPQVQSDIQNAVDVVDTASDDLNASIASLGETQNTMSMLSDAQTDISTSNDELIGSLQDLDYGPASITFTGLEVAMEVTLKTYSKVSELNLFSVL
ncbi:TPA: flagellar hook-associated protein 3 [Escherichia coli]|nr:flagellar hook-associated protein 3 [Escherichia coli]ELD9423200.1 flagellar hook-associated protein 3 [Escherichia coli]HEA8838118.1 flagellar hook-associated protein 3 [Escherichia coli]HEA8842902.1 flagellar hook-associated protein 3 [Escherichia coli]